MTSKNKRSQINKTSSVYIARLIILGILILLFHAVLTLFSPYVAYDEFPTLIPILIYVFIAGTAGGIILLLPHIIKKITAQADIRQNNASKLFPLFWILLIGLAARGLMFASTPVLEDDWIRYLWEGGMGNKGVSAYQYTPSDGFDINTLGDELPPSDNKDIMTLRALSAEHDDYAYNVAYPYLATIYPGVAQQAFRLANLIKPFDLNAWRGVLLVTDTLSILLLIALLKRWKRSPLWIALYWWNPLVMMEGFNSGHMDILLILPLLLSLYFAVQKRAILTGASLGLAVGVKLWPLLLAPLYLYPLIATNWQETFRLEAVKSRFRSSAIPVFGFAIALVFVSLLFTWGLITQIFTSHSGLGAYTEEWAKNNFLFSLIILTYQLILEEPGRYARISIAIALSALSIGLAFRASSQKSLPVMVVIVAASLFLLAPAGYPWYSFWFLPLTAFAPYTGLLALSVTLPIYYLRFPLFVMGYDWIFNLILAPLEFGIPIAIMVASAINHRRRAMANITDR